VFRHCEGKDSRDIRCTYQAKLNQYQENSAKARIMTVIHSCQMCLYCIILVFHIWLHGPPYLLNVKALVDSSVCKQLIEKRMKHKSSICLIETFLLMKLK